MTQTPVAAIASKDAVPSASEALVKFLQQSTMVELESLLALKKAEGAAPAKKTTATGGEILCLLSQLDRLLYSVHTGYRLDMEHRVTARNRLFHWFKHVTLTMFLTILLRRRPLQGARNPRLTHV
jgi:hypothetical protein